MNLKDIAATLAVIGGGALVMTGCGKDKPATEVPAGTDAAPAADGGGEASCGAEGEGSCGGEGGAAAEGGGEGEGSCGGEGEGEASCSGEEAEG